MSAGKGDTYRKVNKLAYDTNYEIAFSKNKESIELAKKKKKEIKSTCWEVVVRTTHIYRPYFERPITREELEQQFVGNVRGDLFIDSNHDEEISIDEIIKAEPLDNNEE